MVDEILHHVVLYQVGYVGLYAFLGGYSDVIAPAVWVMEPRGGSLDCRFRFSGMRLEFYVLLCRATAEIHSYEIPITTEGIHHSQFSFVLSFGNRTPLLRAVGVHDQNHARCSRSCDVVIDGLVQHRLCRYSLYKIGRACTQAIGCQQSVFRSNMLVLLCWCHVLPTTSSLLPS